MPSADTCSSRRVCVPNTSTTTCHPSPSLPPEISRQTTGSLSPRHPTKTDYFRCGNSLGSGAGAAISPPESRHSWLIRSLNERANYRNDSDIFREYSTENRLRGSKQKSSWQIILQQKHFASWSYLTCVQVESLQPISGPEFGIWSLAVSYKLPYILPFAKKDSYVSSTQTHLSI